MRTLTSSGVCCFVFTYGKSYVENMERRKTTRRFEKVTRRLMENNLSF